MAALIWNRRAARQFEVLQEYLHHEFGEKSVETFTSNVLTFLQLLVKYPQLGSIENSEKDIRGFVLHKHTTILYKEKQGEIFILALFDNRQDQRKKQL